MAIALAYGTGHVQGRRAEHRNSELVAARQARDAAALLAKAEAAVRAREQDTAALKDRVEKEHANAEARISAAYRANARLLAALGGLHERRTGSGCACTGQVPGDSTASSHASDPAAGDGRLSAETSRALLDLATLADRTAAYAAACHAWVSSLSPRP